MPDGQWNFSKERLQGAPITKPADADAGSNAGNGTRIAGGVVGDGVVRLRTRKTGSGSRKGPHAVGIHAHADIGVAAGLQVAGAIGFTVEAHASDRASIFGNVLGVQRHIATGRDGGRAVAEGADGLSLREYCIGKKSEDNEP